MKRREIARRDTPPQGRALVIGPESGEAGSRVGVSRETICSLDITPGGSVPSTLAHVQGQEGGSMAVTRCTVSVARVGMQVLVWTRDPGLEGLLSAAVKRVYGDAEIRGSGEDRRWMVPDSCYDGLLAELVRTFGSASVRTGNLGADTIPGNVLAGLRAIRDWEDARALPGQLLTEEARRLLG